MRRMNMVFVWTVTAALLFLSSFTATAQEQEQSQSQSQSQSQEYEIDWKIPNPSLGEYNPLGDNNTVVKVGDTLTFVWSGSHNVLLHPSGSCDDSGATYLGGSSPLRYTLERIGLHTFACGVGDGSHCLVGQIFNVTVVAADDSSNTSTETETTETDKEPPVKEGAEEEEEEDKTSNGGKNNNQNKDEKDNDNEKDNDANVLERYQQYFNPGEEQRVVDFQIKPYKVPREVTTYQDFTFNLPPDLLSDNDNDSADPQQHQLVHIVMGDVLVSQPKHLHHFVISGCTDRIDPSEDGMPTNFRRSCTIPMGGWAVGGGLFNYLPLNAGQLFGPGMGIKALNLNIHYTDGNDVDLNNPNAANDGTNAVATDGIRILYTPNLRPQTAYTKPLINVGFPVNGMTVPSQASRFFYTKTCQVESPCRRDANDEHMNLLGERAGMPGLTCVIAQPFCTVPSRFQKTLQMLCPVSCGLCDNNSNNSANHNEYYLNAIMFHAHLTGREMYATLLPKNKDDGANMVTTAAAALLPEGIDLQSKEMWLYDDQQTYDLSNAAAGGGGGGGGGGEQEQPYVTVREGDQIQVTCVYDSMSRDKTTLFGLSTYDEMCITSISMIVDTPTNLTTSNGALLTSAMFLKSFVCAVDDDAGTSDIWRGSLEPNEDARNIWKDHPMVESDCTYPVGSVFGGILSDSGDTMPTGDVQCVAPRKQGADDNNSNNKRFKMDIICLGADGDGGDGVVFDGDAPAGDHCEGGSMHNKDSNDISGWGAGATTQSLEQMCTGGGGEYEPYTCKDAEDFLTGMESILMDSDTKEYIRTQWWQPRCCRSISFDDKEEVDVNVDVEGTDASGQPLDLDEATSGAPISDSPRCLVFFLLSMIASSASLLLCCVDL